MSDRQGPSESATNLPIREARFGNDNQIWNIIKSGKTKRWARQTTHIKVDGKRGKTHQALPKSNKPLTNSYYPASRVTSNKKYYVHDNGGRPFMVIVQPKEIRVYAGIYDFETESEIYKALVLTVSSYAGYWVGTHKTHYLGAKWTRGNSILIRVENSKYISIGSNIYQFETKDEIYDYHSEVGNNDVPYPIALGTDNIYFMVEESYVPRSEIQMEISFDNLENGNLIGYYYGHLDRYGDSYYKKKKLKKNKEEKRDSFKARKLSKLKVLSKRSHHSMNMHVFDAKIKKIRKRSKRRSKSKKKSKSKK
jgi:hypothetical protein